MTDQKKIWELQLMRYFITHKGYTQVRFIAANSNVPQENDTWLANPNATYTIIHITQNTQAMNNSRIDIIRQQAASLSNVIRRAGKVLDISLDVTGTYIDNSEITSIAVYPGGPLPDDVLRTFPDLNMVVFDVNDPEEEQSRLEKQISDYAMKNNTPGKRAKREAAESMSRTFIIASVISIVIYIANFLISKYFEVSSVSASIFLGSYYKAFVIIFSDYWRFLTAGFSHGSFFHIWCNIMALYSVSKIVEDKYGFVKTMAIMIVSIIFGNICVFIGDGNQVALGLSGGIYGLFASMMVIFWQGGYFRIPALRRNIFSNIYMNILISFLPNVSLLAHLGGFVAGLFMTFMLDKDTDKSLKINFAVCAVLAVVAMGYMGYKHFYLDKIYLGTDMEVAKILDKLGLDSLSRNLIDKVTAYYGRY